jgi:hypothetical protein
MWFGGQKVGIDHKMWWFESDFGAKNEQKKAVFCPFKMS